MSLKLFLILFVIIAVVYFTALAIIGALLDWYEERRSDEKKHESYKVLTYKSPNGYVGKLVPWDSIDRDPAFALWIFGPDGHRVLHAGYSNLRTMDDLKHHVDTFPEFLNTLGREDLKDDNARD